MESVVSPEPSQKTPSDSSSKQVTTIEELKDSTDAELTKIRLMRAFVEARDPSSKEVDDLMIRRFLRARNLDVEKASAMFLKYLKWKRSIMPNGYISPSEIAEDIAQEKVFVQGLDKKGRPIVVAFAAKHFQSKNGADGFKRIILPSDPMQFAFQVLLLNDNKYFFCMMPPGQEKFLSIADIEGWGYANSDLRGYLNALSTLQDCYPERLGKMFIVHAPYLFMRIWKMIYPFIDDNTKKKIVFVENKKLKSTLLEEIEESQLPDIYGGQMPLVPIQDS
ncbi:hypothetical protein V8G54_008743 [Vigna mungo]|uniref:CRAL-TRIO domain-containing protein n=1 Tax=Vigna mungo TaxID=3915 RepID=A0AAQ3SA57_VIGMU